MDCIRPFIGIVTSLWPYCLTHANYLYKLQENGDSLEKALNELRNARDDVQKKVDDAEANLNEPMKRNDQVIRWFQSVTATEGEVLEILRQVDQETSRRCLGGCCPNCWNDYMLGSSIVQKIASLDGLREKGRFEEVAYKLPPPSVQEEPTSATVGMKSMFDKVWRLLSEDEVRIIGIYGFGGVGKTTLLKQINNAFLQSTSSGNTTTHSFDVVILVVVSKVIDIDAIQKEIGNRLGLSSPERRSIFNALTKKSFLLLLDDIWERVDLHSIGVPPCENKKSKVIFTTRSEVVCGLMEANEMLKVECLSWNEAWSLFQEKAWNEAWSLFQEKVGERALKSFPRARELAEVVARECGGLPLTLTTIGRVMAAKKTLQEWNHAITKLRESASEFPGMGEEVLPLLKLSYDNLGEDMIKSCFLFCALYPEDDSIKKSKLIDYWIGEGLISLSDFNHIDDARNKGYDIIGILKGASLLESGGDDETEVKMHDTIRDLALWIAHDCGNKRDKMFIIKTTDLTTPDRSSSWYNNAERIYLIRPPDDGKTKVRSPPPPPPLKSPNLITLIIHRFSNLSPPPPLKSPNLITLIIHRFCNLSVLPQNYFEFAPHLRVLDLSGTQMRTFPTGITELVELRYLSLSSTKIEVLPEELGKLVNLNLLDLSYMWNLMNIPPGVIGNLVELRVLNLFGSRRVDWDFDEVNKLKHLNDLQITIDTQQHLNKLLSNKNLQMCKRHQKLDWIPEANMVMGIEQQHHLGSSCFQNLIQIEFWWCIGLKDLTWVGYVPNLKILQVFLCQELEQIVILVDDDLGGSKGGGNEIIFKSLTTLNLLRLPKLKSICRNALAFPCLKSMQVSGSPELKKLPFDSGSNLNNSLREIKGGPKWWSELQWEEDHNNNNNNNNNDLLKSKFLPYFVEHVNFD